MKSRTKIKKTSAIRKYPSAVLPNLHTHSPQNFSRKVSEKNKTKNKNPCPLLHSVRLPKKTKKSLPATSSVRYPKKTQNLPRDEIAH